MGIDDESSHPRLCSEVADGVTRNIVRLFREPDAVTPPVRFDKRGLWKRGMVQLLRHRQTKGPGSARLHLNRRATPRLHLTALTLCSSHTLTAVTARPTCALCPTAFRSAALGGLASRGGRFSDGLRTHR